MISMPHAPRRCQRLIDKTTTDTTVGEVLHHVHRRQRHLLAPADALESLKTHRTTDQGIGGRMRPASPWSGRRDVLTTISIGLRPPRRWR